MKCAASRTFPRVDPSQTYRRGHLGDNLFANCLIALDARTGTRLWHFRKFLTTSGDRDISGSTHLATITRDGKQVDGSRSPQDADTLLRIA